LVYYIFSQYGDETEFYVKDILESKMFKSIPNGLMILVGTLILALLPLVGIFTFFSLMSNQFWTTFKQGPLTILLIFLTGIIVFGANSIVSIFNILKIWYKLVIYPAVIDNWKNLPEIKAIVASQKLVVGYLIGFLFVVALLSTPLNKHYSGIVKGTTASAFIFIVMSHLLIYLYGLWKSRASSKTCK
jgi:hypothetical protein